MVGRPRSLFAGAADDPLHARSHRRPRTAAAEVGRHRVGERARRSADGPRSSAAARRPATSARIVRSARRSRSAMGGIAATTSVGREIAKGRQGGRHRAHHAPPPVVPHPVRMAGSRLARRYDSPVNPADIAQSLDNLKLERDAIVLYDALAAIEKDERRADAFQRIAGNERRHADIWATKLRELGADVPPSRPGRGSGSRFIILVARLFGTHAVSDLVQALEGDEEETLRRPGARPRSRRSRPTSASTPRSGSASAKLGRGGRGRDACAPIRRAAIGRSRAVAPDRPVGHAPGRHLRRQRRPRQQPRRWSWAWPARRPSNPGFILLAGIAGLLAGAFSMAAGEYISMQSQRELFERQIALERAELEAMPEEEEAELARIYRAKGFTADEAGRSPTASSRIPSRRSTR